MYKTDILFWAALHPDKRGSFEDYVCHLSSECIKKGIKIRFVFENPVSNSVKCMFKKFKVKYHTLEQIKLNSIKTMVRVIKETRPIIVHFHFISHCSLLIPVCRLMAGKKIILTEHSSSPIISAESKRDILPIKYLRRKFYSLMIDRFIAVSDFVANRLKIGSGIPNWKITTIHNGIDVERFMPPVEKKLLRRKFFQRDESRLVVSYVGQLIPEKGVLVFLHAARTLLQRRTNMLFVMAGQGSQEALLKKRAREWGISSNMCFLGLREDVEGILGASDVFVAPSIWGEAFGLVIAEAMACEVPVVASRVGGIPELVTDSETGILVSPDNSNELAKAVDSLLANEEMRINMGILGRKRVLERFSIKKMVSETIMLYRSQLTGR